VGIFNTHDADVYRCGLCSARFVRAAEKAAHLVADHCARLAPLGRSYHYIAEILDTHRLVMAGPIDRDTLR